MDLNKLNVNILNVFKIVAVFCSLVVFTYSTFATIKYVDEKHIGVMSVLNEIRSRVTNIEVLQREILRRSRNGN